MKEKISVFKGISLLTFFAIIILWCSLTYTGVLNKIFLPTPSSVLKAGVEMYRDGSLFTDSGVSILRVFVGWAASVLLALPLGMMSACSKTVRAIFQPIHEFARYLPVAALIPITLLYFGIGELQKYAIIFLGTYFQLVLMVSDGVSSVDKNLINAARTLGASKGQIYYKVLFPASMPSIMDSLRLTIGWAWTYLIVAEMVAANSGLGYMILKSQRYLATDRIFAGLILIGIIGLATDWLFRVATKLVVPWHEKLS